MAITRLWELARSLLIVVGKGNLPDDSNLLLVVHSAHIVRYEGSGTSGGGLRFYRMLERTRTVTGDSVDLVDALVRAGMTVKRAKALAKVPQRLLELSPKRPFRDPGSQADQAFFVQSGMLAKYRVGVGSRRQILAIRFAGEAILPCDQRVDYGLQAIVPSSIIVVSKEDFDKALVDFPELSQLCLRGMQRQAAIAYEWLVSCGSRDSTTRVAHLICELAVRSGFIEGSESLQNPFTQMQMAEITGQTSVNVNRVLADLERSGLLKRSGSQLVITDWVEFKRLANFSSDYLEASVLPTAM